MRKTLLAAAIMGVFAPSVAQAQTANVTMYGALILDSEVIINTKQDGTSGAPGTPGPGAKQNVYRVSSNSSRFGVRGTESLGDGSNAIFQLEWQPAATAAGPLANRDIFAGLQGGWGTLKAGFFFSPYYDVGAIFGNLTTFRTSILASQSLWANNGYSGSNVQTGSFAQRIANSVRYDTPSLGGFTGNVQVGARTTDGDSDLLQQRRHAYVLTTAGQYRSGPVAAAVAYEAHNNLRQGTVANPKLQDQGLTATGSYDFGVI